MSKLTLEDFGSVRLTNDDDSHAYISFSMCGTDIQYTHQSGGGWDFDGDAMDSIRAVAAEIDTDADEAIMRAYHFADGIICGMVVMGWEPKPIYHDM